MKKPVMICLALISLMMFGCATIPPPIPGTVKIVNKNEGAYGYGTLFRGHWSKDDLFAINPATGNLMWAIPPALRGIKIESALSRDFWKYLQLDLIPDQEYTLYILWARFYGRELGESVVNFKAYIDPRRRCHVDKLGRRTCASEIVYLPRVNTTVAGPFRIHKTFYTAEAIKDLISLPFIKDPNYPKVIVRTFYPDPTRILIENRAYNVFVEIWLTPSFKEGKVEGPPDFDLPPQAKVEAIMPLGKHPVYAKGKINTAEYGWQSVGVISKEVSIDSRVHYGSNYGDYVTFYQSDFLRR